MRKFGVLAFLAATIALSSAAEATPMLATFAGQLTDLSGSDRPFGTAEIGAPAVARFVFDTGLGSRQDFGDRVSFGGSGADNPVLSATVTIGGMTVAFGGGEESSGAFFLGRDASLPQGMRDYFGIMRNSSETSGDVVTGSRLSAGIMSESDFVPGLDPFPTFSYSPGDGDQVSGDYAVQSFSTTSFRLLSDARGTFAWNSLTIAPLNVPAPAAYWLFCSALLLLGLLRRLPQRA